MNLTELSQQIKSGDFQNIEKYVTPKTLDMINEMSVLELEKLYRGIFTETVNAAGDEWGLVWLYFIIAWRDLFVKLKLPANLSVYEIATGDTICVPQAMNIFTHDGKYVTLNINKELSQSFISKTENLDVDIRIIEDNGVNILNYYAENTFNVVAFQHAVNDIVQTIFADQLGLDTLNNNWWEIEMQMAGAAYRSYLAGTLKRDAGEQFIDIIRVCARSLQQGGYLIFNNATWNRVYNPEDYSLEFHSMYIPIAREWIAEAGLGLEEVDIAGYDKTWWMILKKTAAGQNS
jgi:hypothetical protein